MKYRTIASNVNKTVVMALVLHFTQNTTKAFTSTTPHLSKSKCTGIACRSKLHIVIGNTLSNDQPNDNALSETFDTIANTRYACTRFKRHNNNSENDGTLPNPMVLQKAMEALSISLRAPTGFNAQPYRAIIVSDPQTKCEVAKYCLGRNADRVRDSDCTVVFLADLQCTRDFPKLKSLLLASQEQLPNDSNSTTIVSSNTRYKKPLTKFMLRKIKLLIALFSSGYPLPRLISNFISYIVRSTFTIVGIITRHKLLLPSLAKSETWASKNTMLFAMMYMLSCTSKNIVTCPMEGYQSRGIKRVLNVPSGGRFQIPLIVSTGMPYHTSDKSEDESESDDAGMSHGGANKQKRFAFDDVIFENKYKK